MRPLQVRSVVSDRLQTLDAETRAKVEDAIDHLAARAHEHHTVALDRKGSTRLARYVEGTDLLLLYGTTPDLVTVYELIEGAQAPSSLEDELTPPPVALPETVGSDAADEAAPTVPQTP